MNKLFSKIAALSVGLAMAIGVGVAVGSKATRVAKAAESTVSMSSFSSISGSVDSDPYISYEARKGSAANDPVVNSGVIRVYQNGGEFEVNAATGASMTSVTISSSMATSVLVSVDDTAEGSNRSITANGSTTVDSISASSVLFTCMGTDKNSRLYVKSLSVTYETGGVVTTYTITYAANGGSGTMEPTTGSNPAVAECTFTAPEGDAFKEWNTAANGGGTKYEAGDKPGADLNLYAIWEKAPSEVTFVAGTDVGTSGGQNEDTITKGTVSLYCDSWRNNDAPYRIYSTGLVISSSGNNIVGVEIIMNTTYLSSLFTANVGTYNSDVSSKGVWSGDAQSVTLTASTQARCDSIKVTLKEGVDPSKKNMTIYQGENPADSGTFLWSGSAGIYTFTAKEESTNVSGVSWSVSDTTVATINASTGALTCVKPGNVTVYAEAEGYNKASAAIEISKSWLEDLTLSGSMSKTSYYVGEAWSHEGFTVTATYHSGWEEEVSSTASWTYSPAAPALGVTSVVVTATLEEESASSSAQSVTVSRTNPLMTLYSLADSTAVDVYGVYVGYQEGSGPIIMDGAYGMLCYFGKYNPHDVSGYTEGETVLHVTGSMATYNELRQISSPTISVASGTYDAPETPVVYAAKGGETVEYSSRLTTVTGTAVCTKNDFSGDPGTKDITMSFTVGSNTIQVFYKMAAQSSDTAAYQAMKDAVANETEITVKGFTSWYNGFQVQMNGYVPPAEGYTAEDFAQDLLDQTDLVCAGWEEGDNNHDALEAIWSNLASNDKYPSLPGAEKTKLAEAARDEEGTVVEQAMARYDFLTGKYDLSNFINGRTPIVPANGRYGDISSITSDNTMIIVITIASISALAFTMLLVFKKKKQK